MTIQANQESVMVQVSGNVITALLECQKNLTDASTEFSFININDEFWDTATIHLLQTEDEKTDQPFYMPMSVICKEPSGR